MKQRTTIYEFKNSVNRMKKFRIIEKTNAFKGYYQIDQYLLQHTKFDGSWSNPFTREVFERGQSAALLPYDPIRDQFVLIEQFRAGPMAAGFDPWMLEIPAGIVENGEEPEDVALRETEEETGGIVTELIHVMDFFNSQGGCSEWTALYCGKVDASTIKKNAGLSHEHEDILTHVLPRKDVLDWLQEKKFNNATIIIALQWFSLNEAMILAEFSNA